uniref:Cyclin-dependent kinases regulatory subunit n=1 Tax=Pygocentrus nattereri TaxID=42514 RepID=A0AAR2LE60_PYGNA
MHLLLSLIFMPFCLLARHVVLPRELAKQVPKSHLMSEDEWRRLGVQQSLGWVHYMIHEPEPHILLFRRPLPKQ